MRGTANPVNEGHQPAAGAGIVTPCAHPLTPLLSPRSIAVIGASRRPNTPGHDVLRMLERGGFAGCIYPVNPRYESVLQWPCHPRIGAIPEPVDLAVLSVANERLEEALREAAAAGARSAAIFASGYLAEDFGRPLVERMREIARAARMPVCGGNCMGFYNEMAHVWVCGFPSPREPRLGGITLISHAGSVFGALAHNDPRLRFNLVISSGQELVTTMADYMDYALEQPDTRVIGLFLETVRDPGGFVAALRKAADRGIPVVALKVGRTAVSAAMALSHSGAMAGDDAAYEALFDRTGVIRVADLDEMACTLLLLQSGRRATSGGLVAVHDSGGEREMVIDLAADHDVPFARIGEATATALRETLDFGLEPVNPLDAWGTGEDFVAVFRRCLSALIADRDAAVGAFFHDLRDASYISLGVAQACRDAFRETSKPLAVITNYSQVRHERLAGELVDEGIPVLDGTVAGLQAIRHLLWRRDFERRADDPPPQPAIGVAAARCLPCGVPLPEILAWSLLGDYGIATPAHALVGSEEAAVAAAEQIGYPVVLKTAMPGILHKTEAAGVHLHLASGDAVRAAYRDLAGRLGPSALLCEMVTEGIELALGVIGDAQFGPVIMVAAGGTLIAHHEDARYALAPFGYSTARRLIDGLRARPLLDGWRGSKPVDIGALARTIADFSVLAADLADTVREIDVNPIIAGARGTVAVDALIVTR